MTVTLDLPATQTATLTMLPLTHPALRRVREWTQQADVHQAVMSLFPAILPGAATERRSGAGILHRHDAPARRAARLLVQHGAALRPEVANDADLRQADLQVLLARFEAGSHVRFRVVLNAVRSQTQTHKRFAVTDPDGLVTFGVERLTRSGLTAVRLADRPRTELKQTGRSALWTAQYDGAAIVVDPEAVKKAVLSGIGRGKAYGCGLLSLATA